MRARLERLAVEIPVPGAVLDGDVSFPPAPAGAVIFVHGSGSSRHSPRNEAVAGELHDAGLATLLMDLLTADEERIDVRTAELRFDLDLLATRVGAAVSWVQSNTDLAGVPVGLFGASTGAGAALVAAATFSSERVGAVVSRGGRPDLAGADLGLVRAPTLLIVGERDDVVLRLNRQSLEAMTCSRRLEVVAGATHLFDEPGALEQVASLARDWFCQHLTPATTGGRRQ
jgi:dienelactone hydrolase